ncbi:NADH dehydrogenase (ubiquinone) B17.2 subunit [Augochlora pura]
MAKQLGLDKVKKFFQVIVDNGGIYNCLKSLRRIDAVKSGTLVGVDADGNKYYKNDGYFYASNRWVVYADKYGMDYDGSLVPPEWFGWLHYKTDLPPNKDPSRPNYKWMAKPKPNLSGTNEAYMPYSTVPPKIQPWKPQ